MIVDDEVGVCVVQYKPTHDFRADQRYRYLTEIVLQAACTGRSLRINFNMRYLAGYLDAEGDNCCSTSGRDIPGFEMAGGLAVFVRIQVHSAAYIKEQTQTV